MLGILNMGLEHGFAGFEVKPFNLPALLFFSPGDSDDGEDDEPASKPAAGQSWNNRLPPSLVSQGVSPSKSPGNSPTKSPRKAGSDSDASPTKVSKKYPFNPHDASGHHFETLKNDLISYTFLEYFVMGLF